MACKIERPSNRNRHGGWAGRSAMPACLAWNGFSCCFHLRRFFIDDGTTWTHRFGRLIDGIVRWKAASLVEPARSSAGHFIKQPRHDFTMQ